MVGGVDNVLVSAASRGIIQRDHQPKALFYKNYQLGNPFDNVTDRDLEQYKKEVEKKSRRGVGKSGSCCLTMFVITKMNGVALLLSLSLGWHYKCG